MSAAPRQPTRARVIAAGLAAATVFCLLTVAVWLAYEALADSPIRRVAFAGEVERMKPADLQALEKAIREAPAESVTLEAVREAARRLPWVREATVRRVFPDALEITVEAHQAVARWNDDALVSDRGDVFVAETDAELPHFRGPDGAAAGMLAQYRAIAAAVAPLDASVAGLRLTPRGAWVVVLDTGLTLQLGRGEVVPRLARFVAAWPRLSERPDEAGYVDLRYPNGFAIRRAAVVTPVEQKKK